MLLADREVERVLTYAKAAFRRFDDWEYNNTANEEYPGFALWGMYILDQEETTPRRFFVTFDIYDRAWRGHLTIGQPNYFWSSADFGDAYLLDTRDCTSLEEAVAELKREMADLFRAMSEPL